MSLHQDTKACEDVRVCVDVCEWVWVWMCVKSLLLLCVNVQIQSTLDVNMCVLFLISESTHELMCSVSCVRIDLKGGRGRG